MMEDRKQQNQEWFDTELEMMLRKTYGEKLPDSEVVDTYLEEAYMQLKKGKGAETMWVVLPLQRT